MGAGGFTGSSGIRYAMERQKFGIGVDTDEYFTTFKDDPIEVDQL